VLFDMFKKGHEIRENNLHYPKLRIRVRNVSQKGNKNEWASKILSRKNSGLILRIKIENSLVFAVLRL